MTAPPEPTDAEVAELDVGELRRLVRSLTDDVHALQRAIVASALSARPGPQPAAPSRSYEEEARRLCVEIGLSVSAPDKADDDPAGPDDDALPRITALLTRVTSEQHARAESALEACEDMRRQRCRAIDALAMVVGDPRLLSAWWDSGEGADGLRRRMAEREDRKDRP